MGRRSLLAVLVLLVTVAGCAGDGDDGAEPVPTQTVTVTETGTATETETVTGTETETAAALAQECTNPEAGYRVSYPEGWQTNPGDVIPMCSVFDPSTIQLEEGTEIPSSISVRIDRAQVGIDQATEFGAGFDVVERREATVAGNDAVVALLRATDESPLLESGTMVYSYYVEGDAGTLIASTNSVGELDFDRERSILDAMMASLSLDA